MSFIPGLTYSIASTVWSGTSAALGKGHSNKSATTTTVTGPGSLHHHHHHHHHSSNSSPSPSSSSHPHSSPAPNGSNGFNNSRRFSQSRRHSNANYNFSRSHPNGPGGPPLSSSIPMTPPHSPGHYSYSGASSDRRSSRRRNPSISPMPRTPPSSPLHESAAHEPHSSSYNFSRKRNYMENTSSNSNSSGNTSRPSSMHGHYSSKQSTQNGSPNNSRKSTTKEKENVSKAPTTAEERYRVVDDILETENLYRVLAVSRTATAEEIRRAYIAKSRICHPDKFPEYPRATEAFQKLSLAYETLSKPSSRFVYDSTGGSSGRTMLGSDETLQSVLSQVFFEFMDGDFEVIRNMINTMNNNAGGVRLGEDVIGVIEEMFLRLRFILHGCKKYMTLVHDQVQQLSDIHHSMRSLAYLDVLGRFRLTLKLSKVMLTIPMIIQDEMRREMAVAAALEGASEDEETGAKKNAGIVGTVFLNDRVETVLKKVVSAIETGERWV